MEWYSEHCTRGSSLVIRVISILSVKDFEARVDSARVLGKPLEGAHGRARSMTEGAEVLIKDRHLLDEDGNALLRPGKVISREKHTFTIRYDDSTWRTKKDRSSMEKEIIEKIMNRIIEGIDAKRAELSRLFADVEANSEKRRALVQVA